MTRMLCSALVFGMLIALVAVAGEPVGWRTYNAGKYPDADPPTKWSADANVVWKCPMPSWSNASPVVLADRIFVCSEKTELVCVNKADGAIMWKHANDYDMIMNDEEKAQAQKDNAEVDRIRKEEIAPIQKQLRQAEDQRRKLQPPKPSAAATRAASASVPAPLTDEQKAEISALNQKIRGLGKELAAAQDKLAPFSKWVMPATEGSNGHSSATPVSDGKVVAAVFNNGLTVCYDIDGNLKWARFIDKPQHKQYGSSTSPLIFQDKLLVHFKDMVALDLATGKELWRAPDTTWTWGTPILVRVGKLDLAVTGHGDIIRLSDGKVLAKKLCHLDYNSPTVDGDVVYFIQRNGKAVKLVPKGDDDIEVQTLWSTKPMDDRYYASPLALDGLIYDITQARQVCAIDAATGEVAAEKKLDVGKKTVYTSFTLAGKYLFISNEDGTTVVLEPGKEFKEVATNTLEPFRCTPVFEGKRMYIRGYKNLYCIGQ